MGEIFQRQFSRHNLEWTGERLTSGTSGQIEVEHFHRYFIARHLCRNLDVLDLAAGEGYGTAFLAQTARSAIGVELSLDAVRHARQSYVRPNLTYLTGDARSIPLRDKCVDVVVSFETIEHFYEQDRFLEEIRRVLRPGGKLIISSPNRDVYSQPETAANPYHALELSAQEFSSLVGKYFSNIHILEQRAVLGSALIAQPGSQWLTFEKRGQEHFEMSRGLPRSPYVVAIASNDSIEVPASSIYVETSEIGSILDKSRAYPSLAEAYTNSRQHAENLEKELARISGNSEELRQHASNLESERERLLQLTAQLQTEHQHLSSETDAARDRSSSLEVERHKLNLALEAQRQSLAIADRLRSQAEQTAKRLKSSAEAYRAFALHTIKLLNGEVSDHGHLQEEVIEIERSGLFDLNSYEGLDEATAMGMTPAEHYLRIGEAVGLSPSQLFDPAYYADSNPDVAASGSPLLLHYVRHGRTENRASRPLQEMSSDDPEAISKAVQAIQESGLFDIASYAGLDEATAMGMTPAEHYIRVGEAAGLAPSRHFDPAYYAECNPDVAASGSPLLLHFVQYGRAENRASRPLQIFDPVDEDNYTAAVQIIENSGLFEAATYEGRDAAATMDMSPAEHYLKIGETAGLMPSEKFNPNYYAARYPDIGQLPIGRLLHYARYGRAEGRRPLPFAHALDLDNLCLDPACDSIAVIVHDASRTGAPILAWNIVRALAAQYNVIVLLRRSGPLEEHFSDPHIHLLRCFDSDNPLIDEIEASAVVDKLCRAVDLKYAIANSVESREYIPALERRGVPVVALVHEFSAYTKPNGVLWKTYSIASEVVFSSQITLDSSLKDYLPLQKRPYHIIPQGPSELPSVSKDTAAYSDTAACLVAEETFLIIGMGMVQIRKGVDLFIATAAEVHRRVPNKNIRFLWIGGGYRPDEDLHYSVYLREQLYRSGLDESMFVDEVDDLQPYLSRAQLFFLSSRLDPLPNVAIDAMLSGLPLISFDSASGIADLLSSDVETSELVVPHMSVCGAAERIINLVDDHDRLAQLGKASERFAQKTFNMHEYVEALDVLGRRAACRMDRVLAPLRDILDSGMISRDLMLNHADRTLPLDAAVRQHLVTSKTFAPWSRPGTGDWLRRPLVGFHPLIYAAERAGFDECGDEDPLAHFLRTGRPEGRWLHQVLQPTGDAPLRTTLKAALHAHFHYPELLNNLLDKLKANASDCDLFLTTTDQERADVLRAILEERQIEAGVEIVPNRGRDLGPFLTHLLPDLIRRYDIIGHIHGKRSLRLGAEFGERWREFLWQHLIGADHPMMDYVFRMFEDSAQTGLVFPLDPHLIDWTENRNLAEALTTRMGLNVTLPTHFEFPVGTMFWARADALRPLLELKLDWTDYPAEPAKEDGTILHALERLLPFVSQTMHYKFATTHVPGSRR
ncbi:rhamnan synthesis F family protein [Methylobacterium sp. D54C]